MSKMVDLPEEMVLSFYEKIYEKYKKCINEGCSERTAFLMCEPLFPLGGKLIPREELHDVIKQIVGVVEDRNKHGRFRTLEERGIKRRYKNE